MFYSPESPISIFKTIYSNTVSFCSRWSFHITYRLKLCPNKGNGNDVSSQTPNYDFGKLLPIKLHKWTSKCKFVFFTPLPPTMYLMVSSSEHILHFLCALHRERIQYVHQQHTQKSKTIFGIHNIWFFSAGEIDRKFRGEIERGCNKGPRLEVNLGRCS